jgi:uncharacterized protein YndB with AHSA1/START domain
MKRFLKKILFYFVILIAFLLIVALFVKKEYAIEKEITINRSQQEVFEYLKYLKNQDEFSKWSMMDPKMKKSYRGKDGKVGFVASWKSTNENIGCGEQEIIRIQEGKRIDLKLRFKTPFEAEDDAYLITDAITENQTNVKWGFQGKFPYPMNLMGLFIDMEKAVGGDLQTGLTNLKRKLEKK